MPGRGLCWMRQVRLNCRDRVGINPSLITWKRCALALSPEDFHELRQGFSPHRTRNGRSSRTKNLSMENKFTDNNDFDKYAREHNKWIYDNAWTYKGEFFASYMLEGFGRAESGKLVDYLVMLRDDKEPSKAFILHGIDTELHEV